MKVYVGNLASSATEQELSDLFSTYGQVVSARIIKDKFSGQSRGFAFVEMSSADEAQAAIAGLNGFNFKDQALRISEARSPEGHGGNRGGGFGGPRRGGFGGSGDRRGGSGFGGSGDRRGGSGFGGPRKSYGGGFGER